MRPTGLLFISGLTLALLAGKASGSNYYLYSPTPVSEQQARQKAKDEIAVREITVTKGDSLYKISRSNSGKGMYYPQLLLFNKIAKPRLIHPGQVLRVPMPEGLSAAAAARPVKEQGQAVPGEASPVTGPEPMATPTPALHQNKKATEGVTPVAAHILPVESKEQTLYAKGVRAYKSGKCRQAIATFDRFLARYPDSPLAADASLYRADCYLSLAKK